VPIHFDDWAAWRGKKYTLFIIRIVRPLKVSNSVLSRINPIVFIPGHRKRTQLFFIGESSAICDMDANSCNFNHGEIIRTNGASSILVQNKRNASRGRGSILKKNYRDIRIASFESQY
jgi:hypothetical protein